MKHGLGRLEARQAASMSLYEKEIRIGGICETKSYMRRNQTQGANGNGQSQPTQRPPKDMPNSVHVHDVYLYKH
jgi:hypothetical protein